MQSFLITSSYSNSWKIKEKKLNEEYINFLLAKIEKDLYKELNSVHSENNDLRFWKIINILKKLKQNTKKIMNRLMIFILCIKVVKKKYGNP
tara:strand:+ start:2509 stop:2784 length:276 start_codon:yes stop_codon:yes gene_type:complete